MKRIILIVFLLVVWTAHPCRANDIYDLIQRGQWQRAKDLLSQQDNVREDGSLLFFQGLLEPSGTRSARLLESALEHHVDRKFQEEIYFRLAQYYLVIESPSKVSDLTSEYRLKWEKGKYRLRMIRLAILANEFAGRLDKAAELNAQYLKSTRGEDFAWGMVDVCRILLAQNHGGMAFDTLKMLTGQGSEISTPQAAYLLGNFATERKDGEAASMYVGQLQNDYPDAVGLDLLARRLGKLPKSPVMSERKPAGWLMAEEGKVAGYFAVKVGTFANKDIAKGQIEHLKVGNLPTDIETTNLQGRKYYVVYVGRTKSREQVEHLKQRLESGSGEKYEVVIR